MAKHTRFTIKPFCNPSGEKVFRVEGRMPSGQRIRANVRSFDEAKTKRDELQIAAINGAIKVKATRLSDAQLAEAEAAYQKLNGESLTHAVDEYLARGVARLTRKSVADAVDQFLTEKNQENLRPTTMLELRSRVGLLKKVFREKAVAELTVAELRDVVFVPGLSPRTIKHRRTKLHTFFRWCVSNKYCADNPIATITAPKVDQHLPQIFSVPEVVKLLSNAIKFKRGKLVPYLAISLFGGLRPTEVWNLSPADIDFTAREIVVQGGGSKLRRRRNVVMPSNLTAWLKAYPLGKIMLRNFQKDFDCIRRMSGFTGALPKPVDATLKKWIPDGLRHSALTYHYLKTKHEGETASWGGNSPSILQRHYRGQARRKDATTFWIIKPTNIRRVASRLKA
jgi:integrase